MGAWGPEAWENDGAAGWYAGLFADGAIASQVARTLQADPLEYYEEIRAAAYVLVALGRPYVWPLSGLDVLLEKAVASLRILTVETPIADDAEAVALLGIEISVLESRLRELRQV